MFKILLSYVGTIKFDSKNSFLFKPRFLLSQGFLSHIFLCNIHTYMTNNFIITLTLCLEKVTCNFKLKRVIYFN